MTWGNVTPNIRREFNPDVNLTNESAWSYHASYWSVTSSGFSSLATQVPSTISEEQDHKVILRDVEALPTSYTLTWRYSGVTTYTGSFATISPVDGSLQVGVGSSTNVFSGSTDGQFSETINASGSLASGIWFIPVSTLSVIPKIRLEYLSLIASLGALTNANRLISLSDRTDASNGIDFVWTITNPNTAVITSLDPLGLTSAMSVP